MIINEFDEKEYTDLFYYIVEYLNEANNSKNIPLLILLHINDNYYNIIYYNEDLNKVKKIKIMIILIHNIIKYRYYYYIINLK